VHRSAFESDKTARLSQLALFARLAWARMSLLKCLLIPLMLAQPHQARATFYYC
jgi:hypothetical protein